MCAGSHRESLAIDDLPEPVKPTARVSYDVVRAATMARRCGFAPLADKGDAIENRAVGHTPTPFLAGICDLFEGDRCKFFFGRARDIYPRYDFARMNDNEFGATLELD
jgi:hypothetical protein